MNIFLDEHKSLVADMLAEGIQFMLIGGYAVNYHGYNRTTGDLNVWIKPDNENKKKSLGFLKNTGIDPVWLKQVNELDFTHALVFSIGDEPYKTDFLTKVSGVTYDEADREKNIFEDEGILMPFINLNHLILAKMGTGRGKDKIDIEMLQHVELKKIKDQAGNNIWNSPLFYSPNKIFFHFLRYLYTSLFFTLSNPNAL